MRNYDTEMIIEHFDDKFYAIIENMKTIIDINFKPIAGEIGELIQNMKIVKTAAQTTNQDQLNLQQRVGQLEAAA